LGLKLIKINPWILNRKKIKINKNPTNFVLFSSKDFFEPKASTLRFCFLDGFGKV